MTCFALAAKCGGLGASGLTSGDAASRPSCSSKAQRATMPKPPPVRARNSRREEYCGAMWSKRRGSSIDIEELVEVEQHEAEVRQSAILVRRIEQGQGLGPFDGGRSAAKSD